MSKRRRVDRGNRYGFRLTRRGLLVAGVVLAVMAGAGAYVVLDRGSESADRAKIRQDPVVTEAQSAEVRVVDRDYEPRDLTAPVGATITWVWDGDEAHNVIEDRGAFESPLLRNDDEWSMTFDTPGTYYYYCSLHHVMMGTLRIVE